MKKSIHPVHSDPGDRSCAGSRRVQLVTPTFLLLAALVLLARRAAGTP